MKWHCDFLEGLIDIGQLNCFNHKSSGFGKTINAVYDIRFDSTNGVMKVTSTYKSGNTIKTLTKYTTSTDGAYVGYLAAQMSQSGNIRGVYYALENCASKKLIYNASGLSGGGYWSEDKSDSPWDKSNPASSTKKSNYANYKKLKKESTTNSAADTGLEITINNEVYSILGPFKMSYGAKGVDSVTAGSATWTSSATGNIKWASTKNATSWSDDFSSSSLNNKKFFLAVKRSLLPESGSITITIKQKTFTYKNSRAIITLDTTQDIGLYKYSDDNGEVTGSISWVVTKVEPSLKIIKADKDTGTALNSGTFKIYAELNNGTKGWMSGSESATKTYVTSVASATTYTFASGGNTFTNLRYGTYYIYEITAPSGYNLNEQDGYLSTTGKGYTDLTGDYVYLGGKTITSCAQQTFSATNVKIYELTINKLDKYTNGAVNATFNIQYEDGTYLTSSGGYSATASNITTPGGSVTIRKIKRGTYHIYEVGVEAGYTLEMQDGYDATTNRVDCGTVVVDDSNQKASVTYYNKGLTSLRIKKEDNDDQSVISGMGFTVYDNYMKKYINSSGQYSDTAVTHYTSSNGVIEIKNITVYSDTTTYTITEVASNNLYYKADSNITNTISYVPDSTGWVNVTIENTKPYYLTIIKKDQDMPSEQITGYFYVQYADGTWLTQSGTYSNSPSSIAVPSTGVRIPKIKRGAYHIYEYQAPIGYDITQQETYGKDSNHPTWVDFGTTYVGVTSSGAQDNNVCSVTVTKENRKFISKITGYVWVDYPSGKANEDNFNYLYDNGETRLSGIEVKFIERDGTVLKTTKTGSDGSYKFTFDKEILYWDLQNYMVRFTYDNETYTVVPINLTDSASNASRAMESRDWGSDEYATGSGIATTIPNASSYGDSIAKYYNKTNYTVETINLGLIRKPDEEFTISENLDYVQLKKGNYTFKYKYGAETVVEDVPEKENIYEAVQEQTAEGFTQKLYPCDIAYNKTSESNDEKFEVYVNYKITIKNTMTINIDDIYKETNLNITSLTNSYNTDLYVISDDNWENIETDDGIKARYKNSIDPISSGKNTVIIIQFKVRDDALQEIIQGAKFNPDIYKEAVTVAIANGYHNYTRNDYSWTYSSSNYCTNNSHRTTGEERRSGALTLKLALAEERTISGTVFEDLQTDSSATAGTRVGNGEYDSNENNIKVVKVALLNSSGSIANLYSTEDGNLYQDVDGIWKVKEQKAEIGDVSENGTYAFKGVIPGEYYLKFTYNNGTEIVTDTGGQPIDLINYKSTILTGKAADNSESSWYLNVMGGNNSIATDKYYIDSENNTKYIIEMRTTSSTEINYYSKNTFNEGSIEAFSANMNVKFEYLEDDEIDVPEKAYQIENNAWGATFEHDCSGMNFGIIERPHVDITLEKSISNVKLTLSNGTNIINGNPTDQNVSQYLTSMNPSYAKIEMENDYLYGSTATVTYQLTVRNKSEIDYATSDYYTKGIKEEELVKTAVTKIIDYLSYENSNYIDKSDNVTLATFDENNVKSNYFYPNLDNSAYKEQLLVTFKEDEYLSPEKVGDGKSVVNYFVTVSKLLSNLDDDLGWESYSEIIGLTNVTFTPQYVSHSGNYEAGDENAYPVGTSESDNAESTIVITPSTGEDRSNTYLIAGTIALIVIAGGFILLKKKVLK